MGMVRGMGSTMEGERYERQPCRDAVSEWGPVRTSVSSGQRLPPHMPFSFTFGFYSPGFAFLEVSGLASQLVGHIHCPLAMV